MTDKLLSIGLAGTAVAAICCLTPAIPILFGLIGASTIGAMIYTDAILFPILGLFLTVTVYALWRRRKSS